MSLNVSSILSKHGALQAPSAANASPVILEFTDTLANIAGSVFDTPDASDQTGNKYLLTRLKPGVSYRLTFEIYTKTSDSNWNWEANIRPSGVTGPAIGTTPTSNNYFMNGQDVAFQTLLEPNDVTVTQTGFSRHDSAVEKYRIKSSAAFNGFNSSSRYYDLSTNGQPLNGFDVDPIPHRHDGYMFLFKSPDIENTIGSLTNALINNNFVGYNPTDANKGFKYIANLQSLMVPNAPSIQVGLQLSDFQDGGTFGPLEKNQKYIVGLVVHDVDSDYILYDYNLSQRIIKWHSFILDEAGDWQIYLRQFINVNESGNPNLHPSSAAGIHIDAISTVGAFTSTDVFRIKMTATPFTPSA